jgi:hypothetical protein
MEIYDFDELKLLRMDDVNIVPPSSSISIIYSFVMKTSCLISLLYTKFKSAVFDTSLIMNIQIKSLSFR